MKAQDDILLEQAYSKILLKENESTHTLSTISNPLKQSLLDSLEKYLKAGEHQDGEDFYGHYETAGDLAEDFVRHLKTSVTSKYEGVTDEMEKKAEEANKLRKRLSDQGLHGF
jgi:hypothetical protein